MGSVARTLRLPADSPAAMDNRRFLGNEVQLDRSIQRVCREIERAIGDSFLDSMNQSRRAGCRRRSPRRRSCPGSPFDERETSFLPGQ